MRDEWQPIETAPRYQGARFLGWGTWRRDGFCETLVVTVGMNAFWATDEQCGGTAECDLTHWQPLPEKPADAPDVMPPTPEDDLPPRQYMALPTPAACTPGQNPQFYSVGSNGLVMYDDGDAR